MARLVVSYGGLAQEGERYLVSHGGVNKPIQRALVVENGINRQYWPQTTDGSDKRIRWTDTAFTVNESVITPAVSQATITFDRATGQFTYDDYPNVDVVGDFLIPPLTGDVADYGKYAIKVNQNSGTPIEGDAQGVWLDLNELASLTWYLERTGLGNNVANVTISIAQDGNADGTASIVLDRAGDTVLDRAGDTIISAVVTPVPVAATQVNKVVSFWSEVRSP